LFGSNLPDKSTGPSGGGAASSLTAIWDTAPLALGSNKVESAIANAATATAIAAPNKVRTHRDVAPIVKLIRTSGESRISNFLLWQISNAKVYFTERSWPDLDATEIDTALALIRK
jgi:undecaprenyl diphosphate synthase